MGLDGIGVLFAGWIFQPAPGTLKVLLQDGVHPALLVSNGWVRVQRPDVLNSLAAQASEAIVSANRQCGFIALAPLAAGRLYNSVLRLELSILEGPFKPVHVQLSPEPNNTPLSPGAASQLRHNVRPLLDYFVGMAFRRIPRCGS